MNKAEFTRPIPLRPDLNAASGSKGGAQAQRLLAVAAIYEGAARIQAAAIGSVTVQIVRDWVVNNEHGPAGLIDREPPGQPSRLTDAHRAALARAMPAWQRSRAGSAPIPPR